MKQFACLLLVLILSVPAAPAQEPPKAPAAQQDETAVQQKLIELGKRVAQLEEAVAALQKERDGLTTENERLRERISETEQELVRYAREMFELRRQKKLNGQEPAVEPVETAKPAPPPAEHPAPVVQPVMRPDNGRENPPAAPGAAKEIADGPRHRIAGEVRAIDRRTGLLAINVGEAHGVKIGYLFEIMRDAEADSRRIAVAEATGFLGERNQMTKLKVVEGDAQQIKEDDAAIAIRKAEAPQPKEKEAGKPEIKEEEPPAKKEFRVTGVAGVSYVLDYGSKHGAKLTDKVFVMRDGKVIASLRLDIIQLDYSVGSVVQKDAEINNGDLVRTERPQESLVGRIKFNDRDRGIIIDIGRFQGAKKGAIFQVRRSGRPVGRIILTEVDRFHAYATPHDGSAWTDFQVNDFVEAAK